MKGTSMNPQELKKNTELFEIRTLENELGQTINLDEYRIARTFACEKIEREFVSEESMSRYKQYRSAQREALLPHRRSFLGASVCGALGWYLTKSTVGAIETEVRRDYNNAPEKSDELKNVTEGGQYESPKPTEKTQMDLPQSDEEFSAEAIRDLSGLLWDSFFFTAGNVFYTVALGKLGLKVGNASIVEGLSKEYDSEEFQRVLRNTLEEGPTGNALERYKEIVFRKPFVEECLFRYLPRACFRGSGMNWKIGIPSSVLFALAHNIVPPELPGVRIPFTEKYKVNLTWIPVPQFIMGCFFWHAMKEHGWLAPLVSHSLANQPLGLSALMKGGALQVKLFEEIKEALSQKEPVGVEDTPEGIT